MAGGGPAGGRTMLAVAIVLATLGALFGLLRGRSSASSASRANPPAWRPFSPTSFWNTALPRHARLSPSSPTLVSALVGQEHSWGSWINTTSYSTPLYAVAANAATVPVQIDHPASTNLDALRREMRAVPVPLGAQPAAGTDGRLLIWQSSTDTMWELWQARYQRLGLSPGWHASWGAKITNASRSSGVNPFPFGATASGLALAGGLITIQDIQSHRIDHMLALGVPRTRAGLFVAPANRTDGRYSGSSTIPEGTRFRLDPRVNVSSLGLPPVARMIARAAQRYGMVVRDGSDVVTFYAQDPTPTGSNPYPVWFGGKSPKAVLARFPWNRLKALPPTPR